MIIVDIVDFALDEGNRDSAFDNEFARADPNPDKPELTIEY